MDENLDIPRTMRAAVWDGVDPSLSIETILTPQPRSGEVLVRVAACGVCHTDLHVLKGEVAFPAPAVLGHEVSGIVAAVGNGVVDFAPGDRIVGAFVMPCGTCTQCRKGRDDLCSTFFQENRLGGNLLDGTSRLARTDGSRLSMYSMAALAEYCVIPATAVTALPDALPLEESAVLGCAAFTAYGAVSSSGMAAGDVVAVVATGGIGSSIVQVASHLGAKKIIAVDVNDEKLDAARALGATDIINSLTTDAVTALRDIAPDGADIVFEALGRPETFEQAVSLLADGGRMVAVGIAAGAATARVPITPLVRRGQVVSGSFGARTRRDLPRVAELAADGGFDVGRAVTRRFDLEDADQAYQALSHGEITGRAIVIPGFHTRQTEDSNNDQH
ncbi:zinc-binding dehydrogenase [Microbacterium aerolatum]|nr:zinc-binding dehydrogenase [Microbacterium aerolatum]